MPPPEADAPTPPFSQRFRTAMRTYRFPVSVVIFAAGILLSILALGDFTPLRSVSVFHAIDSATDTPATNYNLVFVVVGPIVSIVGAYLVGAYVVARRSFEHLMTTKSKAEFLRNIPRLEELLWDLTPRDQYRYEEKRAELRVRR
jgi:uncharacterized protein DUF3198